MLEVKGEDLTVKTNDGAEVLVQWKLAHIRSFKAKKDTLTVYSGRSVWWGESVILLSSQGVNAIMCA